MSNGGKRVAWVTGGGSGIGEAGAQALAADGWIVVVSGRRKGALDAVAGKIGRSGGEASVIPLDVSIAADVESAAGRILAEHGRIDLLVNSAGTGEDAATGGSRADHCFRREPAAAGLRQRNPDQPDLEPGFYPDAGQSRLTKGIAPESVADANPSRDPAESAGHVRRAG